MSIIKSNNYRYKKIITITIDVNKKSSPLKE